jgi:hypothetical protein
MNKKVTSCLVLAVANFFTGIIHLLLLPHDLLFMGWFLAGSIFLFGVFYYRDSEEDDDESSEENEEGYTGD